MQLKKILLAIVLIIMLLSFGGCQENKKEIKIGLVGTMTGTQSDLSVSGRRGVEIAVDQINDSGGINGAKVSLITKNDENNPQRAAEIVQEFVDEDVKVVIGHYTSGMMLAAYEELRQTDILYLGPTISADSLSEIDDKFIRFIASTKEQAQVINQIAKAKAEKNFIVIYDQKNIGFNQALYSNFTDLLEMNEGSVLWDFGYQELDQAILNEVIRKYQLTKSKIDGIFVISGANDLAMIAQEFRKNAIDCQFYGNLWAHTNDLIRIGGDSVEGLMVVSGIDYDTDSPEFKGFEEEFEKRFGKQMTFSSIYSYEAMMALAEVLTEIGADADFEAIKGAMIKRSYQGLQGSFYIDENGDNSRPYTVDVIINNEYKKVN